VRACRRLHWLASTSLTPLAFYAGMVTILMNDYPQFKWLLIASLGFFVLVNR
jgi:hypothetical protein